MPILVKDVEWTETTNVVSLNVPLKGASCKNVDIFATDLYIKISYPPYFFEVALYSKIDDDLSKATIQNGVVSFMLHKQQACLWGQLHSSQSDSKEFLRELRLNAVNYKQKKEQEKSERRNAEEDRRKKLSVKEQMRLDNSERNELESKKKASLQQACEDIEQWKQNNDSSSIPSTVVLNEEANPIKVKSSDNNHQVKELPPLRCQGEIQVKFTPRVLATPARESKLPEEELWLQKVAQMNKMKKEKCEDATDVEEMNPIWLKDKGNEFYGKGNFVAAINAYTSALLLDSKIPMLYANRAACHLHLKQYYECIQDCTEALEYYDPPVQSNAAARCRALARRGAAYYNVKCYVEALTDYNAVLKLDPNNEAIKIDSHKIRRTIQGGESTD